MSYLHNHIDSIVDD